MDNPSIPFETVNYRVIDGPALEAFILAKYGASPDSTHCAMHEHDSSSHSGWFEVHLEPSALTPEQDAFLREGDGGGTEALTYALQHECFKGRMPVGTYRIQFSWQ